MAPRIDLAEVVSFRLKLPKLELLQLQDRLGPELAVTVAPEGQRVLVSMEGGGCVLRFRLSGPDAVLTEVALANDERGLFFHRVLGPLVVRHGGDLHVRLRWNTAERNSHGTHAEVRINRGFTTYPGLGVPPSREQQSLGGGAGGAPGAAAAGEDGADDAEDFPQEPPELAEIRRLVDRAKEQYAEYQRLKDRKRS